VPSRVKTGVPIAQQLLHKLAAGGVSCNEAKGEKATKRRKGTAPLFKLNPKASIEYLRLLEKCSMDTVRPEMPLTQT
jgi:hypothetical protein